MELKSFITKTLTDIYKGVVDANTELESDGKKPFLIGYAHAADETILFDVAVTVSGETGGSAGGSINVATFKLGGELESSAKHEEVSRVQFRVKPDYEFFQ